MAKTCVPVSGGSVLATAPVPVTLAGTIVGTAAYMSPEQAEGRVVDARSDLFSFGAVVYEMVTGRRAFGGGSTAATLAAVLREEPPCASRVRAGVSAALDDVLSRLLAKDPGARSRSAAEVRQALTGICGPSGTRASAPADEPLSIAVLPFANLSRDPDNEFFAEGLAEEVIADLSGIRALRVISRASARRFKSSDRHLPTIARELGVRYVLDGSVRRAGSSLRITVQLIDAPQDTHLWAEKYSGTLEDVFAIQESISRRIVDALRVRLTTSEDRQIAVRPIVDPGAYECYLRARQQLYLWTPDSLERADAYVRSALEIVGDNALLHATAGYIQWMYPNTGIDPSVSRLAAADERARRSLALDPELAQGFFVRGIVAALQGRLEEGIADLLRAYERSPRDANVLTELCRFLFNAGQLDALRITTDALMQIDPLTPVSWLCELVVYTGTARFAEGLEVARRMLPLADPASPIMLFVAWQAFVPPGERAEARRLLNELANRSRSGPHRSLSAFLVAVIDGDREAALRHMTPEAATAASAQEHLARVVGEGHAQLGNVDEAIRWVRASIERGMIHYPYWSQHAVLLNPIRTDPRFVDLVEKVRQRWEAFPPVNVRVQ